MTSTVSVTGKCPKCGTQVTWTDEVTNETMLVCKKCGFELGTYGDFHDKAVGLVRDKAIDTIKNALKRH